MGEDGDEWKLRWVKMVVGEDGGGWKCSGGGWKKGG